MKRLKKNSNKSYLAWSMQLLFEFFLTISFITVLYYKYGGTVKINDFLNLKRMVKLMWGRKHKGNEYFNSLPHHPLGRFRCPVVWPTLRIVVVASVTFLATIRSKTWFSTALIVWLVPSSFWLLAESDSISKPED